MKKLVPWVFAVGAGVAGALAMPGPGLAPLLLLVPGLLLEALDRSTSPRQGWFIGWLAGTVHWLVAVNWVLPVMDHYGGLPLLAAVGSLLGMAAILGLCWAAAVALTGLVPPSLRIWSLGPAWVAVDALRRFWPFEFPWHPPAIAFASTPSLLGSLPVWGTAGLGWAAITLGAGAWALLRARTRRVGGAAACTALMMTGIVTLLAPPFAPSGVPVTVAVIQPGTSLEEKWDPSQWREMEASVWRLTLEAAERGAEVVLWPESALPYRLDSDPTYRELVTRMSRELEVTIVLNAVAGSAGSGFFNSAYAVRPDGVLPTRYDKVRLVPFGEYVPGWARIAFSDALVREVGNFTHGEAPVLLQVGVPLGMAVCYEVVFEDLMARETREGAELLATLTNDGWYGYSWAPRQHFAHVVLRAVENRRWFARAALTGISGFVDPDGAIRSTLEVGDHGVLIADVWPSRRLTPRARFGDWFSVICWVAVLGLLVHGRRELRRAGVQGARQD